MESGLDKNQTIGDYAVMLEALVPGAIGFYCVDGAGARFFEQAPESPVEFSPAYDEAVRGVLEAPERAGEFGSVELESAIACLLPLEGDQDRPVGVMTILLEPSSSLTWEEISHRASPAIRSLQRELMLRFRLVTSYKKLNVRSAEENLLHQVEKLVHLRRSCADTLSHILLLCRKFLKIDGTALLIPEKHIRLFEGKAVSSVEARLLLSDMSEPALVDPIIDENMWDAQASQPDLRVSKNKDLLALPVRHDRQEPVGILILSGWEKCEFSSRRRRRIGRYLVAHIEDVISRDYDALTGLMSWQLFESRLVESCRANEEELLTENFIMYCDIDQFHVINETFGPDAGDEILAEFARLLRDRFGHDRVTRINGDTFAALVVETDLEIVRAAAEELAGNFAKLERAKGDQTLRPSVSIGVAPISGQPETASTAIAPAQVACRAAKDRGRGRVESYQKNDVSIIQRFDDMQLVGHIRSAIENSRLLVAAQPIVSLTGEREFHYFEVLTRLINSSGEEVRPAEFFSAAERYHLMEELDRVVVTNALEILSQRRDSLGSLPLRIAINLSGQSLSSEQFLPFIEQQLETFGVPAQMLCFEITETVAVANLQRAQSFMHALKKLGCSFSLDDFGTGMSSFAYLKMFPIDTLKIDGSFVRDITTNVVSQSVVAAISEVARVMELDTVAEYIEDDDAFRILTDLGVTYGQGFLLGQPEPLAETLDRVIGSVEADRVSA